MFTYRFYTQQFSNITEVIAHMQQLNKTLVDTNLHNLLAFNNTYLIITQAVFQEFGTQFFQDNQRMEKLDIIFAKYYFDALHDYVQGAECAPAWKMLFDACKRNNLYQWQYMALGVNAHVNNDLPFTLYDANFGPDYQTDFNRINRILFQQIQNVVRSLNEKNHVLNILENNLVYLYRYGLSTIISKWRTSAWQNYQTLLQQPDHKTLISRNAARVATYFGAG